MAIGGSAVTVFDSLSAKGHHIVSLGMATGFLLERFIFECIFGYSFCTHLLLLPFGHTFYHHIHVYAGGWTRLNLLPMTLS